MKELNRKVFNTIFIILSAFIFIIVFIYNVEIYRREYSAVQRNLSFMEERISKPDYRIPILDDEQDDKNFENMMIMDYEVYTVILSNGEIERIISHSSNTSNFDVQSVAEKIVTKKQGMRIGSLYNNKYSYNYYLDTIIIINTKNINNRLMLILIKSLIILLIVEILVYYVSKMLTKRITKPAQESYEKQRDFIADASHELKTPLAVIIASSDELKSDKKNAKYVDNIKYESERMNNLIKSLLDLSKLENGVSIANYKEENISKIIERICLTFEAIAYENNVNIDINIEKDIKLKCSKEEIEKLISILLDNAIKHSYKDSSISVNLNNDKNSINLEIVNSGDPIKAGDEEKIFERFYRSDKSRKRDSNRYGLGLAIAKNIVINHNGTIKAFSKDGLTTFKINLKK
ncbi:MAG: HAMP domain-containing histidine kinase [Bacilli bacterium]|nr:HAMP domain-containing histidine kinase [Bacilli bacterium]MBQ7241002.1 HAMP domain-containing histidine kinase [Bacilli bacterium]